ncbi:putative enzyme related to lactoylglutathione lyase [Kitasatospora sp. GAS204A]|uniref:VOC family protein n=1 Tax=unclassified Kitasatospora TaxID=2633591 RepID=UPI002476BC0D|nr:VOC family protein [Kitasatospora sp. GAS204B]MDH6119562.1 putative enzyme related to lactoylglutathione lyase [Kitasatospora sp. GAS204B]
MTSRVHSVTFDCKDTYVLAKFWSQVTGWPMGEDDHPGDPEAVVLPPADSGASRLLFIAVPEGKTVKNRGHLDLQPQDRSRDEEVERLIGLGATLHEDHRRPDGTGWVTLLDPEGNEFCVERSAAERAATGG